MSSWVTVHATHAMGSARMNSTATCVPRVDNIMVGSRATLPAPAPDGNGQAPKPYTPQMAVTFTLNGKAQTVTAPAEMPLLWVLRDTLGMTGTKFGCGLSECGACTVHVDGKATKSCSVSIGDMAGKRVMTIEGLSPDRSHPVQKAWIEEDVPQCGYCQAGQ